jgi:hypothetical protein
MEDQAFSKQQIAQLKSVVQTAVNDAKEEMKDFTRAQIRASEARTAQEIRASEARTAQEIRASEWRMQRELHSVVENNILPVIENHEVHLIKLEHLLA